MATSWQRLKSPRAGVSQKIPGFSLMEVLISLAILSIILSLFIGIPLKAVEKSGELQDTSTAIQETQHIFVTNFKREFGLSKHLLPISLNVNVLTTQSMPFDGRKQLFLAYYDSKRQKNIRVGYLIQPQANNPHYYQLLRAEIPENANLQDYQSASPNMEKWQYVGISDKKNSLMLETSNSNAPIYFQYCVGNICSDNITPKEATGVKIVSKAAGNANYEPIRITLNKSTVNIPSLYFRLGSLLTKENSSVGLYAFPSELDRQLYSRLGFRDNATAGARRIIGPTAPGTGNDIQVTDPSYNPRTGNYIATGQSITGTKTFYILRWSKRSQNHPGYEATASSTIALHPESISQNPFPVAIGPSTAAYPGVNFNFVSVTEDDEGYIYILATNTTSPNFEARIYRYSPSGNYISYSNIASTTNPINGAYGIAFSPSTPKEVHVLVSTLNAQDTTNNYFIRAYDKLDNHVDATQVSYTAESPQLNVARISGSFFADSTPTGLDIIPEKNYYVISGISNSSLCRFVSFPINLPPEASDEQFGTPFSRGFIANTVNTVQDGIANPLSNCRGVAVDPSLDTLTTPLDNPNGRSLSYVGLNASLNRSFQ